MRAPRLAVVVLVQIAFLTLCARSYAGTIYFNDFELGAGAEWTDSSTDVTPVGTRRFLGQFATFTNSLTLSGLSAHDNVTVSFQLFILKTFDGNGSGGPDVWDLSVDGGPTLLHTSFSNVPDFDKRQSYPDAHPAGDHPAWTGASETQTLGYVDGAISRDSVYELSFTFAHTDSTLVLHFSGVGLQPVSDESWGLDNVRVETDAVAAVPEPTSLALLGTGLAAAALRPRRRRAKASAGDSVIKD